MMKWLGCLGVLVVIALIVGGIALGVYNNLVGLGQAVDAQWGQVENVYQRRADLIPNLVEAVKDYMAYEQETLTRVTQARAAAISAGATQAASSTTLKTVAELVADVRRAVADDSLGVLTGAEAAAEASFEICCPGGPANVQDLEV